MKSIVISEQARIPEWCQDLESFRRWAQSDDFPERGHFAYLNGHLWVDLSMERLAHNRIKQEVAGVHRHIEKEDDLGMYLPDRMLLTNIEADLSTEPDGMFVSHEAVAEGRTVIIAGDDSTEVIGSPDMTLEVISPTSVQKDTILLRQLYWDANVREYWLIDSREKTFSFDILRRSSAKFLTTRKQQGWMKSLVFNREFRLTRNPGENGVSTFLLEWR